MHLNMKNRPPASALDVLMNACEPAQFGRGNKNVLDESYRKAGQSKADAFRSMLGIRSAGLIRLITERLLGSSEVNRAIRAELYNLNVYGQGSFFKAHVDTPRGKSMFGSLVVFYPTAHEGGAVVLRKNGQEWTYDSSQVLADDEKAQLGYVAFYSDVEHEVLPVTSGHLSPPPAPFSSSSKANSFKAELQKLLNDPDFLPNGGRLGFGLEYAYPAYTSTSDDISDLRKYLKGVDADLLQIMVDFALESSFWGIISSPRWGIIACKGEIPWVAGQELGDNTYGMDDYLSQKHNARVLLTEYDENPIFPVTWVKIPVKAHWQQQAFISYGNDASIDYAYHAACLMVEVGVPGDQRTPVDDAEEWPMES